MVERSFHISNAVLQAKGGPNFPHGLFEVHAIVEKTDYILCYLGEGKWTKTAGGSTLPVTIQQPLNLNISEGEEIILYVRKAGVSDKDQVPTTGSVYLTGYFIEEPTFAPNLDDLLDDDYVLDEDSDGDNGEDLEGENDLDEQSLTPLLLEGSLMDSDSEDDDDFIGDLGVEGNTRKRLALPPVVEVVKVCGDVRFYILYLERVSDLMCP